MSNKKNIKIALVGNPNSGKSSIFNALTGLRQKIGNYPGITVDKKTGSFKLDRNTNVELTDLPGTYSLYPKSNDEKIVYDILINPDHANHPDGIIVVTDVANLKRNLLFCSQIIDLNIPVVIALSMADIMKREGHQIDLKELSSQLGVSIIPINARKMEGLDKLKEALTKDLEKPVKQFLQPSFYDQPYFEKLKANFPGETDYMVFHHLANLEEEGVLAKEKQKIIKGFRQEYSLSKGKLLSEETMERYRNISRIIKAIQERPVEASYKLTEKLDRILTHRVWGYGILLLVLFIIFQSIFFLAEIPMQWVETGISAISKWLFAILPAGWLTSLLIDGLIAGIGGVVIFIPQIALLFGFLTLMEDSGYMARVSFLTDRIMKSVGLNGKSVIPLMSGLACAIPAIMSARNIDSWKERLITILVTPLMSCSARLPVYTLIISLSIPNQNLWGFINFQGLTLLALYLLGAVAAMAVSFVFSIIIKTERKSFFILELPIYRPPRWKNVIHTMYEKAKVFTLEAGKVILIISVILWFLASYGPEDFGWAINKNVSTQVVEIDENTGKANEQTLKLRNSFAGHFGKFIEPAIQPLGFDWKMGIALIASFAAREVFVGTMATIYSVEADEENFESVRQRMEKDRDPETGKEVYTLATAFSLLVFFAFAMQCMSTLAVVKRETKSWKWPIIQAVYMTGLAYLSSLLVYQLF